MKVFHFFVDFFSGWKSLFFFPITWAILYLHTIAVKKMVHSVIYNAKIAIRRALILEIISLTLRLCICSILITLFLKESIFIPILLIIFSVFIAISMENYQYKYEGGRIHDDYHSIYWFIRFNRVVKYFLLPLPLFYFIFWIIVVIF